MKKIFFCLCLLWAAATASQAQDPDLEADERSALEDIFRSSDEPGEVPVGARGRKRVSVPKGATRVGCQCMDDTPSATHSSGACSGHGGVRYWYYQTMEGDTVRVLTARHERHPHPLTEAEKSEMVQVKPKPVRPMALAPGNAPVIVMQPAPTMLPNYPVQPTESHLSWSDAAAVGIGGIALYASLRYLLRWLERNPTLTRYALRHLLRHRKRPAPRKNRPNPPAPRD